ncbi:MAG: flagellar export protein FliJ [Clostridiales bacterium]|jgi:flagellar FliJ protein|nr:flagellar export protein FliJ [Clostridiales bacterium]
MARFLFRLQPLLGVKEQIESQKEIEYGQALRRLEEERQAKRKLVAQKEEQIVSFRKSLDEDINPADIRRYNNMIERLKQRIMEQDIRIDAAEAYAEKKRLELVEAMKQRKMLDSIKEHRYEDYLQEEKLEDQKLVDQLVSYTYAERD